MIRIFSSLFIVLLFCFKSLAQQVPNGSFETWTGGEPNSWKTTNQTIPGFGTFTTVSKESTDPRQGSASAKLTVITKTIPVIGTKLTLPGVMTLGKLNIDPIAQTASVSGGYPFAGIPEKLIGYIKYQPVNNDQCAMGWGLTKWNNGMRDTIGYGAFNTTSGIDSWTYFEIPLTYRIREAPDTMNILFLNSNPLDGINHTGTTLWIDDLAFVYGTVAIEGITSARDIQVYADPASGQLMLSSTFGKQENLDISLFTMSGTKIRHWKRSMHQPTERLDVSNLSPGTYLLRITSGKQQLDTRKITILN